MALIKAGYSAAVFSDTPGQHSVGYLLPEGNIHYLRDEATLSAFLRSLS